MIQIFGYLDVDIDIWDQELEQQGTLGHAHTGFELYLEKGFDEYIVEIYKDLENRSSLIEASSWMAPGDHLGITIQTEDPLKIGTRLTEKLYEVAWLNQAAFGVRDAYPETLVLEYYQHHIVLPIKEFPPSVQELIYKGI